MGVLGERQGCPRGLRGTSWGSKGIKGAVRGPQGVKGGVSGVQGSQGGRDSTIPKEGKGATEVPDSILRPQLSPPPTQWGSSNRSTNTDAHRNKYTRTVAHRNKYPEKELHTETNTEMWKLIIIPLAK